MAENVQAAPASKSQSSVFPGDVQLLKAEGNALFVQNRFLLAIEKYSAAIEKVPDNAILYSNRAACYIGLERCKEAVEDARKATKLDPRYPKGWGRLGAALEALNDDAAATDAYASAVACFPIADGLSDTEKKLKQLYTRSLHYLRKQKPIMVKQGTFENKLPWDLAKLLLPQPPNSSAQAILAAYQEFEEGVELMKTLQVQNGMAIGKFGGIVLITNAILRDERVFHCDGRTFLDLYNNYITFESMRTGAWIDIQDPVELIRLAKARIATAGWDVVRQALAITIRGWIMRAFLVHGFGDLGANKDALTWYERVIAAIELGRREWQNVHRDDRGVIFDDTFLRGVRSLHINVYLKATAEMPGSQSPFPLSRLLEMADAMISECATSVRDPSLHHSPDFIAAFYDYPVGVALSIKGYYHSRMGRRNSKTTEEAAEHMAKCAKYYMEAAEKFPEDDEQHVWFLRQALDGFFYSGTAAKDTLPLMARIREVAPKMRKIWLNSALAMSGRDQELEKIAKAEEDFRRKLAEGEFTLEDKVMLQVAPGTFHLKKQ